MAEEAPKERLAYLNKVYIAMNSEEWLQIWKPIFAKHRQVAINKRCVMDAEKEDPNLTIIKWIDEFFTDTNNLLIEREDLESQLKDSEKGES